jgi:hypothetical protein
METSIYSTFSEMPLKEILHSLLSNKFKRFRAGFAVVGALGDQNMEASVG